MTHASVSWGAESSPTEVRVKAIIVISARRRGLAISEARMRVGNGGWVGGANVIGWIGPCGSPGGESGVIQRSRGWLTGPGGDGPVLAGHGYQVPYPTMT